MHQVRKLIQHIYGNILSINQVVTFPSIKIHRLSKSIFTGVQLQNSMLQSELQIREGIEDKIQRYFFLFLNKNICCDSH